MAIKKVLLQKKIEGTVYDIYTKTSADLVVYSDTETVAQKLASLAGELEAITTETTGTIDSRIKAASDALYNKIMGLTDEDTTINDAFDTLKEVAEYLAAHGDVVTGFTTDIAALQEALNAENTGLLARMSAAEGKITTLEGVVGDDESGLVADVAANAAAIEGLDSAINAEETGILARLDAVESAETKVEHSETNGSVKVDGSDVQVYDDTELAGRVTDLETTVGDAESGLVADVAANASSIEALEGVVGDAESGLVKAVADNAAAIEALESAESTDIEVVTALPETVSDKDLYMVVIA